MANILDHRITVLEKTVEHHSNLHADHADWRTEMQTTLEAIKQLTEANNKVLQQNSKTIEIYTHALEVLTKLVEVGEALIKALGWLGTIIKWVAAVVAGSIFIIKMIKQFFI